ncbi:MAG TPA: diguanylate cyclase [Gaiellaceae bacterium]|nr:diguanylate cyclase [Gaiellaceae bacterium]
MEAERMARSSTSTGLKQLSDSRGHLASDALLQLVGEIVRANLRLYDVALRYGSDELVCDAQSQRRRGQGALREDRRSFDGRPGAPTHGLAESEPTGSLEELIARAPTPTCSKPAAPL